jgi:hypothetical protein
MEHADGPGGGVAFETRSPGAIGRGGESDSHPLPAEALEIAQEAATFLETVQGASKGTEGEPAGAAPVGSIPHAGSAAPDPRQGAGLTPGRSSGGLSDGERRIMARFGMLERDDEA